MCTVLLTPGDNPIAVNKYIMLLLNIPFTLFPTGISDKYTSYWIAGR